MESILTSLRPNLKSWHLVRRHNRHTMKFKSIHVLFILITLFNPVSIWASDSADLAIAFVNSLSTMQHAVDRLKTEPTNNDMMSP
jgi:hypothetical protein